MNEHKWNIVPPKGLPWINRLNDLMLGSDLPLLNGNNLYIASDYSGSHKKCKYETISILIVDIDNSRKWFEERRIIRDKYLPEGRRMSYKTLNDKYRQNALLPFLYATNYIHGICISLSFRKNKTIQFITKDNIATTLAGAPFRAKWSWKDLNSLFRILFFVNFFIAGFAKDGQNIYWMSDEDAIFANQDRTNDALMLLSAFAEQYVDKNLGDLGQGTTIFDDSDRINEDIVSIPDLSAGALSELFTLICDSHGKIAFGLYNEMPKNISPKSDPIISWLGCRLGNLKKLVLLFEPAEKDMFKVSYVRLSS